MPNIPHGIQKSYLSDPDRRNGAVGSGFAEFEILGQISTQRNLSRGGASINQNQNLASYVQSSRFIIKRYRVRAPFINGSARSFTLFEPLAEFRRRGEFSTTNLANLIFCI